MLFDGWGVSTALPESIAADETHMRKSGSSASERCRCQCSESGSATWLFDGGSAQTQGGVDQSQMRKRLWEVA